MKRTHLLPKGKTIVPLRLLPRYMPMQHVIGAFSLLGPVPPKTVLQGGGFMRGLATPSLWR